jgi:hypothetical protein
MTSPAVAVIIPHFNRADLLHETLRSLQQQSLEDWEAVVVDDGSDASEWKRARGFNDHRVRFVERTDGVKGPSRCRNLGWQMASAPFVMFVDSDDLLAPWCLESRVNALGSLPDADAVVFPVMLFHQQPGDAAKLWNSLNGTNDLRRFLRSDPPWHTSSPLWRREALQQVHGFDEAVMYGDDADLHIRALLAGQTFKKFNDQLPDAFVRRADTSRITNTLTDRLLDSRETRLARGSAAVQAAGSREEQLTWQGQYLVEAEFLLFNVPDSRLRQDRVLKAWREVWQPAWRHWVVARNYLTVAQATKSCCYNVLRVARRAARALLPECFFPTGGQFETAELPPDALADLRARLNASASAATRPIPSSPIGQGTRT